MEERRRKERVDEELADLTKEIEDFKKEKERIRTIIGRIGGMPTFNTKLFNVVLAIMVLVCLVVSLRSKGTLSLAMVEFAVVILSFKIIFLVHSQTRVNHLPLWIMTALEWRMDEILKQIKSNKS